MSVLVTSGHWPRLNIVSASSNYINRLNISLSVSLLSSFPNVSSHSLSPRHATDSPFEDPASRFLARKRMTKTSAAIFLLLADCIPKGFYFMGRTFYSRVKRGEGRWRFFISAYSYNSYRSTCRRRSGMAKRLSVSTAFSSPDNRFFLPVV